MLAEPLSDLPGIFAAGAEINLVAEGTSVPSPGTACRLEEHWFPTGKNAGRVVLKLSGCNSINDAEALSGRDVLLPNSALPTLEEDTFFVGDLLGCEFFNGETRAGTIVDVQFATGPDGRTRLEDAAPLLGIELSSKSEPVLVPFVRAWLETVDLAKRRVIMHIPEGLLIADEDNDDEA
jgi:16S rRNA processing protein RimM